MNPTSEQIKEWKRNWLSLYYSAPPIETDEDVYIAQRAAEWATAQSEARIAELERQSEKLLGALEFMLEVVEPPPERNCRCHISPPCNDCVDYGGLRDAFKQSRAAIAEVRGAK